MKLQQILIAGLAFGSTFAFAGTVNCTSDPTKQCAELDIIVRDFQVTHPDFENFQEEAYNSIYKRNNFASWVYPGYADNAEWQARRNNYVDWACGNSQTPEYGIPVGTDGYPKQTLTATGAISTLPDYLQSKLSQAGYTWYGEFKDCHMDAKLNPKGLKIMRGYAHELCASEATTATWGPNTDDVSKSCSGKVCNQHSWSQIVYVTPGMASRFLTFDANLGEDMMYEPIMTRFRAACDNGYFDQWYADRDGNGNMFQPLGINARMNTVLQLPLVAGTKNTFEIDYNWNNGGYFPLDVVDANNTWQAQFTGGECPYGFPCQFGPQSLSIFCPPYSYQWAANQTDYLEKSTSALCTAWLSAGGPRSPLAAATATKSDQTLGMLHLRNYGFTMMGYAKFKYNKGAGEVFEFAGDDDMWIYVDGVLAVDLGGTHLAAPGKADMDFLSQHAHGCHEGEPLSTYKGDNENCDLDPVDGGWKNGSWHHLHFFYADRQTDGSNMKIHSTLSELAKSRYGQPAVGEAVVKVDEDGSVTNSLFLNTALDPTTVEMMQSSGAPSILVIREVVDPVTGAKSTAVYGYYVSSMTGPTDKGSDGMLYNFSGELRDAAGNVISGGLLGGDKIAFNVMYDDGLRDDGNDGSYTSAEWEQLIGWTMKMPFQIKSTTGKAVEGFDPKEDWADIQYTAVAVVDIIPDDPGISRPDFTQQSEQLSKLAGSDGLKEDMTADMVLISIPAVPGSNPLTWASDNAEDLMKSLGGAVPTSVNGIPVNATNVTGPMQGTNQTLCFNDGSDAKGNSSSESCTSFAFATTQPFHVNIRVFDHLGNFVNQFNKSVTREDFNKALAAGNNGEGKVVPGCDAEHPLYGGTGAMLANIKVYPVAQSGRLLATGPYIYQVAIVMEQYEYCYMSSGASPTIMTMPYMRSAETYRRGYRREKPKK